MAPLGKTFTFLILSSFIFTPGLTGPSLRALSDVTHIRPGDISLGLLTDNYAWNDVMCSDNIGDVSVIQYVIAANDALDRINADTSLLGNITLGLISLDECDRPDAALGQTLRMVAGSEDVGTLGFISRPEVSAVVGVVGTLTSGTSVSVAPLFNLFDVTVISQAATSDDLSDRFKYPNFFRMVPADSFQTQVMVDMMAVFNWTYISVVHSETSYGYNGLKFIRRHARRQGICIADSFPIADDFDSEDFKAMARKLQGQMNAHVVVVFAYEFQMRAVIEAAYFYRYQGFVWILSESAYAATLEGLDDVARGSFIVDWHTPVTSAYKTLIDEQSLVGNEDNTYFTRAWSQFFSCDVKNISTYDVCRIKTVKDLSEFYFFPSAILTAEAIYAFAYAIDALIRDTCPEQLSKPTPTNLKDCVRPENLRPYVREVGIVSERGVKRFNEEGEMGLDFRIRQMQDELVQVGIWRQQSGDIEWGRELRWLSIGDVPESVCAKPCQPGEFYIQGELPCCWDCHRCRDNEYVADNATTCKTCPNLSWPDSDSGYTTCVDIDATFLTWSDVYGIGLTILGGLGLTATMATIGVTVTHRHRRVIKGSSWEMITIILVGLVMAFANIPLFIAKPSAVICPVNRMAFSLSCTLIFAPLLIKTHRIYLVFSASEKLTKVNRLAKASMQYAMTASVIAMQVRHTFSVNQIYFTRN